MLGDSLRVWLDDNPKISEGKTEILPNEVVSHLELGSSTFWSDVDQLNSAERAGVSIVYWIQLIRNEDCTPKSNSVEWLSSEVKFWEKLIGKHDLALAFHIDCLLRLKKFDEALAGLVRLFNARPDWAESARLDKFTCMDADQEKGFLDMRLTRLKACLASNEDLDDKIREEYSSLLDEYADRPGLLSKVKKLGREISKAENEGRLPRAFVRRTVT